MDIIIAAVGRGRRSPEQTLYDHYVRRLPWDCRLLEIAVSKAPTLQQRQEQEGARLLAAVEACEVCFALDATGQQYDSVAFAKALEAEQNSSVRRVGFVIGGPDGLQKQIFHHCQRTLSFGTMTWPHMLARALLAEQLFRAYTIMNRHPYHRQTSR